MRFDLFGYTFSITKRPTPNQPEENEPVEITLPAEDDCEWRISEARASLESVNSWINNCDQKAGILLSGIGIVTALLFSTDFIIDRLLALATSVQYNMPPETWSIYIFSHNALCIAVCIIAFILLVITMFFLLKSITANLNENQKVEVGRIGKDSMLFYIAIAAKKYTNFKNEIFHVTEESYLDELLSQVTSIH